MPFSSVLGASSVIKPGVCTSSTRPSVPYEGQLIYETDTDLVLAWNGSSWRAVSNAIATNGGILQIASTTKTDTFSLSSSTFTDVTGFSVSITPTSNTSKALVLVNMSVSASWQNGNLQARLMRNSTEIAIGDAAGSRTRASQVVANGNDYTGQAIAVTFLDSPSTTSSTTYKVQIRGNTANATHVNRMLNDTDNAQQPRTVSTITVFEVSA